MTAATIAEERLAELLSDQHIPAAHRALWALLWDGEIRLREALSLDVRDIDLNAHTARMDYRVKPGPDTVPISERAAALLREAIGEETEGPAVHRFGRPISVRGASVIARTHGFSIHAFRSSGPARQARVGSSPTPDREPAVPPAASTPAPPARPDQGAP